MLQSSSRWFGFFSAHFAPTSFFFFSLQWLWSMINNIGVLFFFLSFFFFPGKDFKLFTCTWQKFCSMAVYWLGILSYPGLIFLCRCLIGDRVRGSEYIFPPKINHGSNRKSYYFEDCFVIWFLILLSVTFLLHPFPSIFFHKRRI